MVKASAKLKRGVAVAIAAVAIVTILPGITHAGPEDIVSIPDGSLRSALLTIADSNADGNLTEAELAMLSGSLDFSGKGISNVTGFEFLTGVTGLNLSDNMIRDISPLVSLTLLTDLNVSKNYLYIADSSEDMDAINALGSKTPPCSVIYAEQKLIPAEGVSLNNASFVGCVGDQLTLTAAVSPADAANKDVAWSSDDPEIATVTDGTVTILTVGTVNITATTADGGFTASCAITVKGDKLSSPKYLSTDGLLTGVTKSTAISMFKSYLNNSETDVKVYNTGGTEVTKGLVATGMTVKLYVGGIVRDTLTVIVNGDVNGDGNIDILDYSNTRLHILELNTLTGPSFIGADVDKNGLVDILDYSAMRLDILGLKPIGSTLPDLPEVSNQKIRRFLDIALSKQGKRYVWGDEGPDTFDCSGLVYYCLKESGYSGTLWRSTANTYSKWSGWQRVEKSALQPGDLMFFLSDNPDDGDHIGHTGIYLGNGYLIHASSSNGCVIISQKRGWYETMLSHGMRINW